MTTRNATSVPRSAAPARGIALLLVMVTLATATVLTTSFLISRENSPDIGVIAERRVASEWSSKSAADLVEAIMETETDWRSTANSGLLIENMAYLGAEVDATVTDLEGGPVDEGDRQVVVTVLATVDGVEMMTQRVLEVRPDGTYEEALDPELNEFGVFAASRIDLESGTRIGVWPLSPSVRAGDAGKIGVGFDGSSGFSAASGTISRSGKVFLPPSVTSSLEAELTTHAVKSTNLPVEVWTTTSERPASLAGIPEPLGGAPIPVEFNIDMTIPGGRYAERIEFDNAEVTLDAAEGPIFVDLADISGQGLLVKDATVRVKGDVELVVLDDVRIDDSAIMLEPDSSLTVYLGEDLHIIDSVVNADPALLSDSNRSASHLTQWTDPRRVRFVQLQETSTSIRREVNLRERAIVVGSIHAPLSETVVDDRSALAGRLSAKQIDLLSESAILLDPVFDNKLGLTEKTSPLYDENGDPLPGLAEALELTSEAEGFQAALARLLAALPAPSAKAPIVDAGGATPRDGSRVSRLREWPVMARVQEGKPGSAPADAVFAAPTNVSAAAELGKLIEEVLKGAGVDLPASVEPGPSGGGKGGGFSEILTLAEEVDGGSKD